MSTEDNNHPPENPRGGPWPVAPAVIGQLLGLGLALILFWLHSGGDFSHLGSPLDVGYLLVCASWLVSLALLMVWVPGRGPERQYLRLWLSLPPALIAAGAACIYSGLMPQVPGGKGNCDLLLANAFWAERLRFVGLLATGSMWWGALISQILSPDRSSEGGPESPRWPWAIATVLFAGSVVWSFLDPVMPMRAKVGGPEVRGLWVMVAEAVVLWLWARFLPLYPDRKTNARVLRASLAACLGLLMLGASMVAFHRLSAFYGLAHEAARFQWGEHDAGAVTATTLLRLAPFLIVAVLVSLVTGLRRMEAFDRKRILALVMVLVAGSGLFLGYEAGWRAQYAGHCNAVLPGDLELPCTVSTAEPREGSLLVVDRDNAWLDETHVIESDPLELKPGPEAMRGEPLNLAIDRRVTYQRLHVFLKAAGQAGWFRFRLLVRQPAAMSCDREIRVFGVCLSEHISNLSANSFEIPHFSRQAARPDTPPEGVVANVIVETDRLEVSFGGFGISSEVLESLGAKLPDHMGVRNLAGLVQVLTLAKERFPASSRLILVAHDDLSVEELAHLIAVVQGEGTPLLFPDLVISRLVR